MTPSQERLAGAILGIGGLLFALLAVEVGVRMLHLVPDRFWEQDPVLGVTLTPGASGWWSQEEREFVIPVQINSHGHRDIERDWDKSADDQRILVLGDSFVEALQVPLESSFVYLTDAALNDGRNSRRREVLNAGVSGYGTAGAVLYFERDGRKYDPDLVVLAFYPGNDVRNNSPVLEDRFPPVYENGRLLRVEGKSVASSTSRSGSLPEWKTYKYLRKLILTQQPQLAAALASVGLIKSGAIRVAPTMDGIPVAYGGYEDPLGQEWQEAWVYTERLLDRLDAAVRDRNARLMVAILSIRDQVYSEYWNDIIELHPPMQTRTWDLDAPQRRIERWCERRGVPCLALAPVFKSEAARDDEPLHFRHDGHWTVAGHRLAAQVLLEFIEGQRLLSE